MGSQSLRQLPMKSKSNKQAHQLSRFGMPISKAREIARKGGTVCLRCLSRTRESTGTRCKECREDRELANKTRKR